jgi:hypothetical protein
MRGQEVEKIITFEKEAKREILDLFGKTLDAEGYIVDKQDPSQKILASDGNYLTLDDFAGIRNGSLIFIRSDINSVIELSDILK